MSTHNQPRGLHLLKTLSALVVAVVAMPQHAAAQSDPGEFTRLGMVGGAKVEQMSGGTLSGGAMYVKGGLAITALGEGFFYHGRPDSRFQETPVSVVYPNAPLVQVQEIQCEDPDTKEIFARGKCQIGKAQLSATIDIGFQRPVGANDLTLGLGYKMGSTSEPFLLIGLSGPDAENWVARVTLSQRSLGFKMGYAIG